MPPGDLVMSGVCTIVTVSGGVCVAGAYDRNVHTKTVPYRSVSCVFLYFIFIFLFLVQ